MCVPRPTLTCCEGPTYSIRKIGKTSEKPLPYRNIFARVADERCGRSADECESLILSAPRVRGVRIANALSHTRRADRGVARRHAAAAVDRHTARRASRKREVSSERGAPAARETRWRTRDWGDPGRGVGRRGRPPRRRRPSSASTRRTRSGSRRARSRRVINARCPRARARRRRAMPPRRRGGLVAKKAYQRDSPGKTVFAD
eukprot:31560-Pelagococcus_subviridis.AAC.3